MKWISCAGRWTHVSALHIGALCILLLGSHPATAAYDIDSRGVPQFVNTLHIELAKISSISKFRSSAGHDYSDFSQFGSEALRDATGQPERCRSMKHYFVAPDSTVKIFAPVDGMITSIREEWAGHQIEITPAAQPDFHFIIFHVKMAPVLKVGDRVSEGQQLGTHIGLDTWSDMAVWVQTPRGKHLISYFETLTDDAYAALAARGVADRNLLVRTKAERDAASSCVFFGSSEEFVQLSGARPAYQQIEIQKSLPPYINIGDAPSVITATASSNLPVEVVSSTPKICAAAGNTVTARRPGVCKVLVTQSGNSTIYEAIPSRVQTTVLPQGTVPAPPRLATVVPPTGAGAQSYLRFFNIGTAEGTVTASLIDPATGRKVSTWKSPPIQPGASPQFDVGTLEGAAASNRPAAYALKIEPETTVTGYLQHVLFDSGREVITNASTCDTGVTADPLRLMNVHTSQAPDYPSSLILYNVGGISAGMNFTLKSVTDGSIYGRFSAGVLRAPTGEFYFTFPNAQIFLDNAAIMETAIYPPTGPFTLSTFTPPSQQVNLTDDGAINFPPGAFRMFYQHRITSKNAGVVTDMTTACALDGRTTASANSELRVGGVLSTLNAAFQSTFRFYNAGDVAGAVNLKIWGGPNDQPLGSWQSQEIPPHGQVEVPIATVEREIRLHQVDTFVPRELRKATIYGMSVTTDIDGLFQHTLSPVGSGSGTLSNVSTCADSVTAGARDAIAVHAAGQEKASMIVVTNTGNKAATATLNFYDARDGALRGSYQTAAIPSGGALRLSIATMEEEAGISLGAGQDDVGDMPISPTYPNYDDPYSGIYGDYYAIGGSASAAATGPAAGYYTLQLDALFNGFLQHFVTDTATGSMADMSAVCMM